MQFLKKILPGNLKGKVRKALFGAENFGIHFAQSGEDLLVQAIMNSTVREGSGFYVDVGSYHPTIGSNTHLLYSKGWHGINIDPRPGSKRMFDQARPRDINLEVGVGRKPGKLTYYFISETSALNSFSRQTIADNGALDLITREIECPVMTLSQILNEHLKPGQTIDFLNIDTEGFEMEVLSTMDWKNNRPRIIAIEQNNVTTLSDVIHSDVNRLLELNQYGAMVKNVITKTVATVIYVDNKYLNK
jgi:FkbM family methyltransferase